MSAFKDAVQKDIKAVFLNKNEFADKHILNGKEVYCSVDDDLISEATDTVANPLVGVYLNAIKIYVDKNDLEMKPVEGALLYFDDETYIVRKVGDEKGMLVITAEVHGQ